MAAEKQWQYQGAQPSSLAALASSQKWTTLKEVLCTEMEKGI